MTNAVPVLDRLDLDPVVREALEFRRAMFDWCLREARRASERGAIEHALQWNVLAARLGCMDCAVLASAELESNVLGFASRLPVPAWRPTPGRPRRWLHVFSEAGPSAGHSAMAWRWMSLDPEPNRHSVVLLSQRTAVAEQLIDLVARRDGEVIRMDPDAPILARAERLRTYAWTEADIVILHVHPWEVVPTLAFGIPGGPPVLLLNHSAHLFGVGSTIADLMINTRQSAQEDEWSSVYRGMGDRLVMLPLVLPAPAWRVRTPELRADARRRLDVPADAPVLVTIGNSYKYTPLPGRDFLQVARTITSRRPNAYVLAAGVFEDARWQAARASTGGRIRAFGTQLDVTPFHAAADVYIEGFPMGSATALLEAAHHGLPCVLAPRSCPPPFGTDGAVYDEMGVDQPADVEEYIARALVLIDDEGVRQRTGQSFANSVERHHAGEAWLAKLDALKRSIPAGHKVYPLDQPPPIQWPFVAFWSAVTIQNRADALGIVYRSAARLGLKPRFDSSMRTAVRVAKRIRMLHPIQRWLITCTDRVAAVVPIERSGRLYALYDWLATVLREDGKIVRFWRALGRRGRGSGLDA